MFDKKYAAGEVEAKFYALWEKEKAFRPKSSGTPYTIIMPPANVTGSLHLGHALTFTLQDILVRYHRMQGKSVLWQPGTDHAGIATQMVVERELQKENKRRIDMGRDAFIQRIWEWKAYSGGTIINQLKRLGASADWSRERFTMDDAANQNIKQAFVQLYKDNLIYRDKRLVNWDAKYQTAISDIEVVQKEVKAKFYYVQYPLAVGEGHITVATTRPETLFGDVAVAVHPEDDRYSHLIGQYVKLPLTERTIPIIGDKHSDPEKGTGAVKITPAHDFSDFEVGARHHLGLITILDAENNLAGPYVPEEFQGLSTTAARTKVEEQLAELGALQKTEEMKHAVPHGDRSDIVIEPRLTDQWYVDAQTLAQKAMAVVKEKETNFIPDNWKAVYFEWMENIQPWCISRQIWWGHEIPAWYGPDGDVFVAETEAEAQAEAQKKYGQAVPLRAETDVLDTWFSSGLWPVITLDGFENSDIFKERYPTSVLVTGFDIIFFWVARMMMLGLYFTGKVPFREVYMHTLVRDARGQKMSKSKGNVIDPLYLIDQYGADALRYTLASMAAPGRDIKLGEEHVAVSRNFTTKIWNATRYALMSGAVFRESFDSSCVNHPLNQWILAELKTCVQKVSDALASYRFHEASSTLYQFFWSTYCDWYLELTKPLFVEEEAEVQTETRETMGWVLGAFVHALNPLMPFISEEIWHILGGKGLLIHKLWPHIELGKYQDAQHKIQLVTDFITAIRSLRSELSIPQTHLLKVSSDSACDFLTEQKATLRRMARVEVVSNITVDRTIDLVVGSQPFQVDVAGAFNPQDEQKRLEKECARVTEEIEKAQAKLSNKNIIEKAPQEIIDELHERVSKFSDELGTYESSLNKIQRFL